MTKIIDGKGAVLGRLAVYVAKEALKGEKIIVLNCEEVIITGNRVNIKKKFLESREKVGSGQKGPKVSRLSERIVKRAIRGMLPHRKDHGRDAYSKIMCHVGVPSEMAGKEKTLKQATNTKGRKDYVTVGELCMHLGDTQ